MRIRVAKDCILMRNVKCNDSGSHKWLNPCARKIFWNDAVNPRYELGFYTLGFYWRYIDFNGHYLFLFSTTNETSPFLSNRFFWCPSNATLRLFAEGAEIENADVGSLHANDARLAHPLDDA